MISVAEAVILGIIQGITEWLPISSKSQVAILGTWFGLAPAEAFGIAIFLHLGTVLAAIVYFRKEIIEILKQKNNALARFILIALIGTAITGLPAYWLTRNALLADATVITFAVGVFLILSGVLQWYSQQKAGAKCDACSELTNKNGFVLGLCQGLAGLPGVSRSGITVSALLLESFSPKEAFRISFLLSIPSVIGLEIVKAAFDPIVVTSELVIGTAAAFGVGFLSLGVLMKLAERISFAKFAILFGIFYLILAGAGFFV